MILKDGISDPQLWARIVVKKALERGTDDNVSVIVIPLQDARISALSKLGKKKDLKETPTNSATRRGSDGVGIHVMTPIFQETL
jgi:hypothetical protein